MKILFVWRQYDRMAGGVERMSIELMNEMQRRGHDIHLMSWDEKGAVPYYTLSPQVQWFKLDHGDPARKAGFIQRLNRIMIIRQYVRAIRPDVIIAFMDGIFLSVRVASLSLGVPVVEAERCSTARFAFMRSKAKTNLIFQSLRLARRITIQLESYRRDYPAYLRDRIVCIPNPVFPARAQAAPAGAGQTGKILLSVGRLSFQKNYTALLTAFMQIAANFPDWSLVLAGDGEERPKLEAMVAARNLSGRVVFLGTVSGVQDLYRTSHLFCLPSRWEGFPNALAEALAHGLPAVGFKGCAGISDLIHDQENGLLAKGNGNTESLAIALAVLMADDQRRERMGIVAAQSVRPYEPQIIFDQWENFFADTAQSQSLKK